MSKFIRERGSHGPNPSRKPRFSWPIRVLGAISGVQILTSLGLIQKSGRDIFVLVAGGGALLLTVAFLLYLNTGLLDGLSRRLIEVAAGIFCVLLVALGLLPYFCIVPFPSKLFECPCIKPIVLTTAVSGLLWSPGKAGRAPVEAASPALPAPDASDRVDPRKPGH